jgi:hypothetical protein
MMGFREQEQWRGVAREAIRWRDGGEFVSDGDLLRLLAEIEAMALRPYPFAGAAQHDPRLPFALGRIADIAGAAVLAATPRRPQVADDWRPADPDTWDGNGPGMVQPDNIADVALGSIVDIQRDLDAAANGDNIVGLRPRPHIASPTCWCNPVIDDSEDDVWIHGDTTPDYQPSPNAVTQGEDAA